MPPFIDHTVKTRLLLRPVKSPLGTIRLAGVNQGGFGVGRAPGPPRTLACYSLCYVMKGSGLYLDAKITSMSVGKGDLITYFPGHPHRCGTRPGEFWDELWFEFEGPAFDLLRDTKLLNPRQPVVPHANVRPLIPPVLSTHPAAASAGKDPALGDRESLRLRADGNPRRQ